MSRTKWLLMNVVSVMTMVSMVTGCCCSMLPPEWQPQITIDLGDGMQASSPVPTSQFEATVGPLATPETISFAPVEIVSQTEISPQEFMQRVQGDQEFADVYALASVQGYTDSETAGEFTLSDGTTLHTLVLRSPAGQRVAALRFARADSVGSLLVRAEGETLILYDRDGRAEMTTRDQTVDIKVYDAAGNPIAETGRSPGLSAEREQGSCTGGYWDDFDHCCRYWFSSGVATTAACMAAWGGLIAACVTGGWALPAALAVFFATCPFAYHCMQAAEVDNPPYVAEVKLPERVGTCSPECYSVPGKEGILTRPKYRFQMVVDDDRPPRPPSPQYIEVCAGATGTLVIKDCAGHTVEVKQEAPLWNSSEDWTGCTGETPYCSTATIQCVECRPEQSDCPAGEECVNGTCVGSGDVRVTLTWRSTADIDLHVIDPSGEEIYYDHDTSASGGQLDVDDQCEGGVQGGPENIFWPTGGAPRGQFEVRVVYYEECSEPGEGPTGWTVTTLVDGKSNTYSGTISPGETQSVCTFSR